LNCKFRTLLKTALPFFTHLLDNPTEFVPHHHRFLREVMTDPLMGSSLHGKLMGRHTDRIGYYPGQDLIVPKFGEFKFLKP
jgi:hypothetical protein